MNQSFSSLLLFAIVPMASLLAPTIAMAATNPDSVLGFEVLIVDGCKTEFSCDYGHSFLRIVPASGQTDSQTGDMVLGFGTNAPSPHGLLQILQFTLQGMVGLPLSKVVGSARNVFSDYAIQQKRQLVRVPLQVTRAVKVKILENIDEFLSGSQNRAANAVAYDVLFNNCAGKIVELLNRSGVPRELFGIAIPLNLPAHLFRTYVALYPPIRVDPASELSLQALPAEFYRYCEDLNCALAVNQKYEEIWPGQSIQFPPDDNGEREMGNTLSKRTSPTHWSGHQGVVMRHFQLLREAH